MRNEITEFAETNHRGSADCFGISDSDRRHHLYIIGKTGAGKTTLLRNLVLQDILHGKGVALIDPHGDLAADVIDHIPRSRIDGRGANEVIYFDPADEEHPVGFNVLEEPDPARRHLISSSVISAFRNLWADSWGPRTEYLLHNAIMALLDAPGSSLLGIPRLLEDSAYRALVARSIQDPVVRRFWLSEFPSYGERFRQEAIAPIQNKVGRLLGSAPIRNILGQPKSGFSPRQIMSEGKIFIANLAKGRLGEDKSNLLGSLLVSTFQIAALERAEVPEEDRRDFFLHIDEFQNFTTESFATILSEARKYRLNLTIAHQYIEQLGEDVRAAVFGNVGSMVAFRVGQGDAEALAREFAPVFSATDLAELPGHRIVLKMMIEGSASKAFSAKTLPPLGRRTGRGENVRNQTRRRRSRPREAVQGRIERWLDFPFHTR